MLPNIEKRALVTGASGFVGSHLVKHLLNEGWVVHILVRPTSNLNPLAGVKDHLGIHYDDGSIGAMRETIWKSRPDVVFHLASLFLSEHQPEDIVRLIDSNLLFGSQLVEAMTLEGVKNLINTGTSWQHYESKDYSPVNLYAATKQAFEAMLQYYVEARALRVITLKLSDTYGQDDPRPKLINLLRRIANNPAPFAMSPGEQLIDLVHVSDVVKAYSLAAGRLVSHQVNDHESYAVSSRNPLSLRELVNQFEANLGRELPIQWGGRAYRDREVMRPWKGNTLPGWVAQHKEVNLFEKN